MYSKKHKNLQKQNKTIFLKHKYNFMEGERAKYVVQIFQILNGTYDPLPKGSLF